MKSELRCYEMWLHTKIMVGLVVGMSWSELTQAEIKWQLKIDRQGIQVFQSQQKGYSQKHSKAVVTLKTDPEQLIKLMENLSICDQWLYGCLSAKAFEGDLIHMVFKGPLWFKDRDVVMSTTTQEIHATKDEDLGTAQVKNSQWQVSSQALANKHTNKDYVRITHAQVSWLITPISADQVKVTYELYIDPQISLKSGVNKYNRDAMFLTLRNIRRLLDKQNSNS